MKKGQKVIKCADCGCRKVVDGDAEIKAPFRCDECTKVVEETKAAQSEMGVTAVKATNPKVVDLNSKPAKVAEVLTAEDSDAETLKDQLFGLNEDLRSAKESRLADMTDAIKEDIRDLVASSKGVYVVDKQGYAVQAKPSKPVKAHTMPVKSTIPAERRTCPCCGQEVQSFKAWFRTGHDGRLHGLLLKVDKGKLDVSCLTPEAAAIYQVWRENKTLTMTEAARRATSN